MVSISRIRRRLLAVAANLLLIVVALVTAFLLRFDFVIGPEQRDLLMNACLIAVVVKGVVFGAMGVYNGWNRHAGVDDAWKIVVAGFMASAAFAIAAMAILGPSFPRSVYLMDLVLSTALLGALRFQLRLFHDVILRNWSRRRKTGVLVGAGMAGHALVRQLRTPPPSGSTRWASR